MPAKPKALIVEDDPDIQFLYRTKLEHEGFVVATAHNGEQGLEAVRQFQPDIILLDIMMPVMDGAEMLARMRANPEDSSIRVIVLTNVSKDEAPQSLRFLRVDRYIVKAHYTPSQVVATVHDVLNRSHH